MNHLLPNQQLLQLGLYGGWGIVMSCLVLMGVQYRWTAQALGKQRHWALLGGLWVWILLPLAWNPMWSPVYWLGLAFQMPSLTSIALCTIGLVRFWRGLPLHASKTYLVPAVMATVLGWVLLLDSFAIFPMSIYVWGFESTAVPVLAALLLLPWLGQAMGEPPHSHLGAGLVIGVLAVFVTLRMPTGNLWDSVIDPLLWLIAQAYCLKYARLR